MEFFSLVSIAETICAYAYGGITYTQLYISLGIAGGLLLLCLIFGGIGLYTMAKRAGYKHKWLAFLPFANTYYAGVIGGETSFFGAKMKRAGLYAMLAEFIYVALNVFVLVLNVYLSQFYENVEILSNTGEVIGTQYKLNTNLIPAYALWTVNASATLEIFTYLFSLVQLFLFCVLYNAVFRKYYARSPFLMTFLCAILPFRGFVLFAVRNNTPVDYNALMRQRMEAYTRAQQAQYGNYGTPYKGSQGGGSSQESPFNDFEGGGTSTSGDSNDSPFSDF